MSNDKEIKIEINLDKTEENMALIESIKQDQEINIELVEGLGWREDLINTFVFTLKVGQAIGQLSPLIGIANIIIGLYKIIKKLRLKRIRMSKGVSSSHVDLKDNLKEDVKIILSESTKLLGLKLDEDEESQIIDKVINYFKDEKKGTETT